MLPEAGIGRSCRIVSIETRYTRRFEIEILDVNSAAIISCLLIHTLRLVLVTLDCAELYINVRLFRCTQFPYNFGRGQAR
jgi:hypothetical protein